VSIFVAPGLSVRTTGANCLVRRRLLHDVARPSDAFEAALDSLDPEERAAFVAAVYAARGWESDRTGVVVLVRPPGDASDGRRVVPPGVEAPDDGTELDPDEFRDMVRYAVAAADRSRLCRRFLDGTPDAVGLTAPASATRATAGDDRPDTATSPADAGDRPDTTRPTEGDDTGDAPASEAAPGDAASGLRALVASRPRSAVVAILACVVAVTLFVAPPAAPVGDSGGSTPVSAPPNASAAPAAPTSTPDGDPDPTPAAPDESIEDSAPGRQVVLEQSYPPGVGVDGVENASALAAAHAAALSDRSYRLSVTTREFADGQPTAVAWERTVVETPARHRSRVRVAGAFRWPPVGVANASTYANGTARVVRVGSDTDADGRIRFEDSPAGAESSARGHRVVGPVPDADPFAARTASTLRSVLARTETDVTGAFEDDGTMHFWIEIRSRSPVADVDGGTLLVDERGLVHEARYTRTAVSLDSTPIRRTIVFRVTPGDVTVSPPPWYRPGDAGG
jgi:hypothetical protein